MKKDYEKPEISVVSVKSEENITDDTTSKLTNATVQTAYGTISYKTIKY